MAECSKGSILQYFQPSLSYQLSLRPLFRLFLSSCFTQVLLYTLKLVLWQTVFVCFVALRPKSTAMVIAGRSVHLTTLFLGRLEQADNQ